MGGCGDFQAAGVPQGARDLIASRCGVGAGTKLHAERRGRRRVGGVGWGGVPIMAVVGGADEDHPRGPGEVGRRRGDPEASVPGGGRQGQGVPDSDMVSFGDLL